MTQQTKKLTYFITGGGTGGHIYPALAVFEELAKLETTADIYYVGNKKNLEYEITRSKKYKFLDVDVTGMPRKMGLKFFVWGIKLFIAIIKSMFYIRKYKPDVIFGTGGYVSAPTVMAGMMLKVPFVLHDCDAKPGLVTRKFAPFAKSISLAFDAARKEIKSKQIFVNGNPIRKEFKTLTREDAVKNLNIQNKLTICIMGGSQGAMSINRAVVRILELLSKEDIQVIFQTGKKHFAEVCEELLKIYPNYKKNKNLIIQPYFDDMTSVLKASDIAVSRAGSLSLSEICACGVAPILVPYPYAAADHQRVNAKYITSHNAGLYLEDKEVTPEKLYELLSELTHHQEQLDEMKKNSKSLAHLNGVERIIFHLNEDLI